MTEYKWNTLRNQFLAFYCHCHEDEVGNRPCDNGAVCDRCMTEQAQSDWVRFYKKENEG